MNKDRMIDSEEVQDLLTQVARRKGIELEYRDIWGQVHPITPETQLKILSAMGCRVKSLEELKREVREEEFQEWKRIIDPVLIVSGKALQPELIFQIPVSRGLDRDRLPDDTLVHLNIKEEDGRLATHQFSREQLLFKGAREIEGVLYLRGGLPLPEGLPLGYHTILFTVRQAGRCLQQSIKVIVCPEKAYLPPVLEGNGKRAGLVVSLAGLRSRHNWGIGDFGDLKELVRWAIEVLQVDGLGLLPLHALSNKEPYNISPYYPSSRLYRNPIYLAIPEIEEYNYSLTAWKIIMTPESQNLLKELRGSEKVQFEKVDRLKMKILERLFQTFLERHWKGSGQETRRQKEFLAYIEQEGDWLDRYAVYCALEAYFHQKNPAIHTWGQWPTPFQDPGSLEVKRFSREHWSEVLFHKYLQWQVEGQLSEVQALARQLGAEIGLYQDLALGSDPWGADSWAWRDNTVPGIRVGAPPDDFSPQGQDWGFYPPNGERYRQEGYQFFAQEIRKNCHPGGALRIDHILKLSRLFWIVEGCPPQDGVYVDYIFEELIQVLALESVRNKTLIIGEDLGTLPDRLRETLQQKGVFSYRLFYFEKDDAGNLNSPEAYPELALASVSTHDLPPLAGFWGLEDILLRKELGLFPEEVQFQQAMAGRIMEKRRMIDRLQQLGFFSEGEALTLQAQEESVLTEELHRAVLSFLVSTKAKLAVLSQEDLFREHKQLNLPGTTSEHPNWSRKMRYTLEELWEHPEARRLAKQFRDLVEESGRGVKKPARGKD
ncbi:MAG: 4-alpha-glucanotransferase [Pseudomonadota bacterium]